MKRYIDFVTIAIGIIGLILSLGMLGVGFYLAWMLIKALHKYLAN